MGPGRGQGRGCGHAPRDGGGGGQGWGYTHSIAIMEAFGREETRGLAKENLLQLEVWAWLPQLAELIRLRWLVAFIFALSHDGTMLSGQQTRSPREKHRGKFVGIIKMTIEGPVQRLPWPPVHEATLP